MSGNSASAESLSMPSATFQSSGFSPAAIIFTRISPGRGSGLGRFIGAGVAPYSDTAMARMTIVPRFVQQHPARDLPAHRGDHTGDHPARTTITPGQAGACSSGSPGRGGSVGVVVGSGVPGGPGGGSPPPGRRRRSSRPGPSLTRSVIVVPGSAEPGPGDMSATTPGSYRPDLTRSPMRVSKPAARSLDRASPSFMPRTSG